ncbi:MAG: tyrosine-type recombinase/integrase [Sphaerochaeta sp.]|nr:tyrosine-type recombinase/integrase [Sphaerochaeta sp.]
MRTFKSKLGSFIKDFINEKRGNGFSYELEEYMLNRFDSFIIEHGFDDGVLSRTLVLEWAIQTPTESINYRNQRVSFIRQFGYYLLSLGKQAYIPMWMASESTTVPYIPCKAEIEEIYQSVDSYRLRHLSAKYPQIELSVLYRLYYCCGLRLDEACNLKRENIDLEQGVLRIVHSKGDKDRLVPMTPDLNDLCKNYDERMQAKLPGTIWFFPRIDGKAPIRKTTADTMFAEIWKSTKASEMTPKAPTVHSLRHAFVIEKMNTWMKIGISEAMLPYLSVYLGHSSISETYYYYHLKESIFELIREKDEASTTIIPKVAEYEQ